MFKPLFLDIDTVLSGEQVHESEQAIRAAVLGTLFRCTNIGHGNRGIGNRGA
jgi:hypothetical protein